MSRYSLQPFPHNPVAKSRRMSLTRANAAKKRVLCAKCGAEVEDGGAAVAVPSRAVDTAAGQACGLDLNDFIAGADAGRMKELPMSFPCFQKVATVMATWTKQLELQRTT